MLYFDEAGYTGADLTNTKQPFFTLASSCITDEEAKQIKSDIGYEEWGKELHFKNMYKDPRGRNVLNKLFAHPLMDKKHIRLAFAQKRFCIYAQIVNILIETYYHNIGVNIYVGANNLVLANCMYSSAIFHFDQKLVNEFEISFVRMIRKPSIESIADFYRTTDKLRRNKDTNDVFCELLSELPQTIICIKEALDVQSFDLDLTIPLFSSSIQKWYDETQLKHDILFDKSEPFYANLELLKSLRDMDVMETKVGYGTNKHIYPLPIANLELADSHNVFGIQIADVYASALNFILTPRCDKFVKYQNELRVYPMFQEVEINIAPSSFDYIKERQKDINGIDPLDFICEHLR